MFRTLHLICFFLCMLALSAQNTEGAVEYDFMPAEESDFSNPDNVYILASEPDLNVAYVAKEINTSKSKIDMSAGLEGYGELYILPYNDGYALRFNGSYISIQGTGSSRVNLNFTTKMDTSFELDKSGEEGHFIIRVVGESDKRELLYDSVDKQIKYYNNTLGYVSPLYIFKRVKKGTEKEQGSFSISDSKYSTLYVDHAFIMPDGVVGSTIVEVQNDPNAGKGSYSLKYEWQYLAGMTVPRLTPIILKGDEGTYTYDIIESELSAPEGNMLYGTLEKKMIEEPIGNYYFYKLSYKSKDEPVLGFWWAEEDGAPFENAANKAYLAIEKDKASVVTLMGHPLVPEATSVAAPVTAGDALVDVYSAGGVLLRRGASKASATAGLPAGIYLVGGEKQLVR